MNGLQKYLPNVGSGSAKTHNLYLRTLNVWGQDSFDKAPEALPEKRWQKIYTNRSKILAEECDLLMYNKTVFCL